MQWCKAATGGSMTEADARSGGSGHEVRENWKVSEALGEKDKRQQDQEWR